MESDTYMESDDSCDSSSEDEIEILMDSNYRSPERKEKYQYTVLSKKDAFAEMQNILEQTNSIIKIPQADLRLLLTYFKWDKEKLCEKYFSGDPIRLMREACIPNLDSIGTWNELMSALPSKEKCGNCGKFLSCSIMTSLTCGHRYCKKCWNRYLTTLITNEEAIQHIPCPVKNCESLVDDETVKKLVVDPNVQLRYQWLMTENFIQSNCFMKNCPRPGCLNIIKVQDPDAHTVTCSCGFSFCFLCSEAQHVPISCQMLKKWLQKCSGITKNWMEMNVKECPDCGSLIEKNYDSWLFKCTNRPCAYALCSMCFKSWSSHIHGWNPCNVANEPAPDNSPSFEKYLFNYERYRDYILNSQFMSQFYDYVATKVRELAVRHKSSLLDTDLLIKAFEVLCQCRYTLMYTFVFAYYLVKDNFSEIFEVNQKDLENSADELSEYLRKDLSTESLVTIAQTVQKMISYCDTRQKVLINHIQESNWKYIDEDLDGQLCEQRT